MSLTLAEAVADIRSILNEPTAVFWSDAEIQDWIGEGTRIVSSKLKCVEDDDDITLVADQLQYLVGDEAWIADCIAPYAAIYRGGSTYKGIQFVHPKQIGNLLTFTPGDPRYYSFHNRSFYVWPVPTSDEAGELLTILYVKESSDFTELPDEYQHLAIWWGQAKAYEKDRLYAQASGLKQNFYSEIQFERMDKITRPGEPARAVKAGVPTDAR